MAPKNKMQTVVSHVVGLRYGQYSARRPTMNFINPLVA